ncbi:hypothetical protein CRUP_012857 [Coryphaenoides rupestris]|nr:hypothetical protein CRUP_012857 [Coryphaenoides rupestris]
MPHYEDINNCHERALVFMHKMPRIWLDYCQFLVSQCKITRSRRSFDRALRALPVTQHSRIWPLYLRFARKLPLPRPPSASTADTSSRVTGSRSHRLSPENAEEYIDYLRSIGRLDEAAVRLAAVVNDESFCVQGGQVQLPGVYPETPMLLLTPTRVNSLKVGAIIRGGLTRFTDQLGKLWCSLADYYIRSGHFEKRTSTWSCGLARFEQLIARRPLLLNSVLLRQNPHNVHEWHKRVKLYDGTHDRARTIFEKATKVSFKQVDDLAGVWCEFGEMELRHENYEQALRILRKATAIPAKKAEYFDVSEPVQNRVFKSLKVWSMLADLEESLGTFQSTKAVYDRIIDLRIATPQIIINYAMFLEEHNYFEESFKAYERGIALFRWPNVYDIWNTYLTKFIDRYGGKKLERARDLFEQALDGCPAKFAKTIYLLYAKLEEEFGLARHAMAVYERATQAVEPAGRHHMFNIYIKRAAEIYGVTYTRAIYQKAIEVLPDESSRDMCVRFADMESKLGEIDRARAIYSYCSQICDPRVTASFWQSWKEFEIRHGNEDTIREMLRIKRSVQATYNTQVNFMSSQMMKATTSSTGTGEGSRRGQCGGWVRVCWCRTWLRANPDEIDIDGDDEGGEENGDEEDQGPEEVQLEQKSVPTAVFGGLKED